MSIWIERFGEESAPEMWELIGEEHFEEFFELGDPKRHAWTEGGSDAVVLDTLEAMRSHLSTVRRDGSPIQLVEHGDRYEFEFDPCGSGGRALRGDIVEDTPSRIREPYGFGVIRGAYEWTDGRAGMCVYCNHCQQLYEQWTIDRPASPSSCRPPTAADGVGPRLPQALPVHDLQARMPFPTRFSSAAAGLAPPLRPDEEKGPAGAGPFGSGAPAGAPRRGCRLPTCRSGHRR